MTCRDCQFLSVPLDKAGRRVPRKWFVYECLAVFVPARMPACVEVGPMRRNRMQPDDGAGCTFHHRIAKATRR